MIRIDKYYDITCDICAKSRSTDYEHGLGMYQTKKDFRKIVLKEGWVYLKLINKTLCPECKCNYKFEY